jgi:hypothetical protein
VPGEWSCDHCDLSTVTATRQDLLKRVRSHLLRQGGSILVHESPDGGDHAACVSHLSAYDSDETGVLCLTKTPAAKLEAYNREVGEWPFDFHVLTPSMDASLPEGHVATAADFAGGPLSVTEIEPTALDSVARDINDSLTELTDRNDHVAVCIDTLTELVTTFGPKPMFKLVHALNGRFRGVGAFAHWHYAPDTQMDSTNHVVRELFQLVHDTRGDEATLQTL